MTEAEAIARQINYRYAKARAQGIKVDYELIIDSEVRSAVVSGDTFSVNSIRREVVKELKRIKKENVAKRKSGEYKKERVYGPHRKRGRPRKW